MKPDYKNWVPKGMIYGLAAGTAVLLAGLVAAILLTKGASAPVRIISIALLSLVTAACAKGTQWSIYAYRQFSYDGKRKLSKQIVEGVAEYVNVPKGGICLDVGCGSGALTIACAKRNRSAKVVGIDRWGKEYASFSKNLCENNAIAEGVMNTEFTQGDAVHLAFADETFDAVTSNYVYHNITGVNKQELLLETIDSEQATPSLSQAQRMKKLSQVGGLNEDTMLSIMSEQKKPELSSNITLPGEKLKKYFPKSYTPRQMSDVILKLLEQWQKKRQRDRER